MLKLGTGLHLDPWHELYFKACHWSFCLKLANAVGTAGSTCCAAYETVMSCEECVLADALECGTFHRPFLSACPMRWLLLGLFCNTCSCTHLTNCCRLPTSLTLHTYNTSHALPCRAATSSRQGAWHQKFHRFVPNCGTERQGKLTHSAHPPGAQCRHKLHMHPACQIHSRQHPCPVLLSATTAGHTNVQGYCRILSMAVQRQPPLQVRLLLASV